MASIRSPVSPNFSMPYSARRNRSSSEFQQPEQAHHHTRTLSSQRSFGNTTFDNAPDLDKSANVENVELDHDATSETNGHAPIYDRLDCWFGGRLDLEPCLRRRHIIMISIGGTIGMGLVLSSSKVLRIGGSTGLILAYALMGIVVAAVMSCIAEMVALIPEPGALALFPRRFVDASLGVAVGVTYWYTSAMEIATLTTTCAEVSEYWSREVLDIDIGWRITVFLLMIIFINVLGVKAFGELEHFCAWLKILMVVILTIFSLIISSGANKQHTYYGTRYWKDQYKMPPNFNGDPRLDGTLGRLLAIWDCCTSAAFAYTGVEIVAMTAAEAKYPKRDFPFAAKCTWLITIGLYVSSVLFVSLCVPWTSSKLLNPKSKFTGAVSPFVIAIDEAGYAVLPGLANAGFLFAAWTAANTQLYVASRTLYGMCQGMTPTSNPWLWPLGRTRKMNGAPVMAILASCIFAPLAFLLCATSNAQKLISIFSGMATVGCLLVWASQCLAFVRFYFGLRHSIYDRSSPTYPYQSAGQPFTAIFGLVACLLVVIFNGWKVFYERPFKVESFLASYLWIIVFVCIYGTHKFLTKSEITPLNSLDYYSFLGAREEPTPPSKGWIGNLFEFEKPAPRSKSAMSQRSLA